MPKTHRLCMTYHKVYFHALGYYGVRRFRDLHEAGRAVITPFPFEEVIAASLPLFSLVSDRLTKRKKFGTNPHHQTKTVKYALKKDLVDDCPHHRKLMAQIPVAVFYPAHRTSQVVLACAPQP